MIFLKPSYLSAGDNFIVPPDYEALYLEYGIEVRPYMNGRQDSSMDNAGWFSTGGVRPRPLPLMDDRLANEAYAHRNGYYWLRCRRCGEFKGGHETERDRICERYYRSKIEELLLFHNNPLVTASHSIMSANNSIAHLAELAAPSHFRRGWLGAVTCPCGSEKDHNDMVRNISFNGTFQMKP